jgi:trehalose 6-phosphate synthase/phosphatase
MKDRLVIVSNRLPIQLEKVDDHYQVVPGSGGLVTALKRIVCQNDSVWIGWPGCDESDAALQAFQQYHDSGTGIQLEPVFLSEVEARQFYSGFSNEIVWPLFHDLQSRCNFDPAYWDAYQRVNARFAQRISNLIRASDLIWVHDYHLLEVARYLRRGDLRSRILFFHHIPFPAPDIFEKLPWRSQILSAMLNYDVVGFQTARDRRNFLNCLPMLNAKVPVYYRGQNHVLKFEGREVKVGNYPIGIDFSDFAIGASQKEIEDKAEEIRQTLGGRRIILGIDRMDYTKGIPERLLAFCEFLRLNPEMLKRVTLLQVAVPSRGTIPKYQELKLEIESLVSTINGEFTEPGWVPIHYIHRSLTRNELLAYYRAAEVALVTPLKDGMNLVAKEFCACKLKNDGVLILSEFAGAAAESRKGALLVNPYHVREVAEAIDRALRMDTTERAGRMRQLRRQFRRNDVFRWARHFVRTAQVCEPLRIMPQEVEEDPLVFAASAS